MSIHTLVDDRLVSQHHHRTIRLSTVLMTSLAVMTLVALAYFVIVRPWHVRWGASDQERAMPLPGDDQIPANAVVSTRAITINAPPSRIWPWIVQLGQARGGWDSYDWIENLLAANMPHTEQIQPQFQQLNVGDKLPYGQDMPAAEVTYVDPGRAMSMGGWTLFLQPIDAQTTRLIVRYPWPLGNSLGDKLFYYGVAEPWHFVMESGMMLGLKQRAEMNQEQQQP